MTQTIGEERLPASSPNDSKDRGFRGGRGPRGGGGPRASRGLIAFALPSVAWYLIFTVGPLVAMFVIAFLNWTDVAGQPTFAGWGNFARLFRDPNLPAALVNTAALMLGTLPVVLVGGFLIGYFLNLKLPGHRVIRVLLFVPALISLSSMAMIFLAVLGPTGLMNASLKAVGLGHLQTAFLANPHTAMWSLIGVSIWSGLGFTAILFAARISAIDNEIFSAAEIDGASHWQRVWRIAYPICADYFGVLSMLQYLWNLFGSAGLILLLTQGGPGTATTTVSWLVYRYGFVQQDIGYSQALGILLFVLGVAGLLAIRSVFRARY